jgi:hypothetical protein
MTKFIQREKSVVEALQFTGGEKEGKALALLINSHGAANATWYPSDHPFPERVSVVTDFFSEFILEGDWLIFKDDNVLTHLDNEEFEAKYEKVKFLRVALIWKDIPGFPNWQVSDNGRVRNVGYPGYKRRTKDGDFVLYRRGKAERWSEAQLGDEEQIKAFFSG